MTDADKKRSFIKLDFPVVTALEKTIYDIFVKSVQAPLQKNLRTN